MTRWEYCAVAGLKSDSTSGIDSHYPTHSRFTEDGVEVLDTFKDVPKNITQRVLVAKVIFRLGQEGWEMVSAAPHGQSGQMGGTYTLFFKRPAT